MENTRCDLDACMRTAPMKSEPRLHTEARRVIQRHSDSGYSNRCADNCR
jgi:hypothetical protein